jgi:hypothetical protein
MAERVGFNLALSLPRYALVRYTNSNGFYHIQKVFSRSTWDVQE